MKVREREIRHYRDRAGRSPFIEWFNNLTTNAAGRVQSRLDRIKVGNFGDYKSLKDRVYKLRIHSLEGLRIYYALDGDKIVLLLCGGSKRRQKLDINRAKSFWQEYLKREFGNVQ